MDFGCPGTAKVTGQIAIRVFERGALRELPRDALLPVLENVWKPLYEVPSPSRTSTAGSKLPFCRLLLRLLPESRQTRRRLRYSVGSTFALPIVKRPLPSSTRPNVFSISCKISVNEFCCCSVVACCTDALTRWRPPVGFLHLEEPPSGSHSSEATANVAPYRFLSTVWVTAKVVSKPSVGLSSGVEVVCTHFLRSARFRLCLFPRTTFDRFRRRVRRPAIAVEPFVRHRQKIRPDRCYFRQFHLGTASALSDPIVSSISSAVGLSRTTALPP